ncbi:hypothetical protein [Vibrio sp. CK2-1]|uniref:hypothetical protein n=1 Tax=Vibrio sp. CK2-1 TaxID=2912249 RepID=UPI001F2BCAEF|nr:hypothetical protein [Vibrio sp. CK2-1]MCF7352983.1 hypothetical protein [Vibrio sp. CK2-1]
MKKSFTLSMITLVLFGCNSSGGNSDNNSSPEPITNNNGVTISKPGSRSITKITDISRFGYKDQSYDPSNLSALPIPAYPGEDKQWVKDSDLSDDFEYTFSATSNRSNFGGDKNNKWYNFYHQEWDGPGATYWQEDHVAVQNGNLEISVSRNSRTDKQNKPGVTAGCISSHQQVQYPVFVEASVSLADISLASAVWLLSPDDTQEIDILEAYAGADNGNDYFSKMIHLSHHSFIREPFQDYQPRDENSWWKSDISGFNSWGEYGWNGGNRQYIQIGVNWVNPYHFEYYINGELVRVVYNNAFATKQYGEWVYSYPKVDSDNNLVIEGYQNVDIYAKSTNDFDFNTLKAASEQSPASVIDPLNYQNGKGFYKPADIIINMELQSWWTNDPTDSDLADTSGKNKTLVDWVRVFKPIEK